MDREQRRRAYLQAMDIAVWVPRHAAPGAVAALEAAAAPARGFGASGVVSAAPDGGQQVVASEVAADPVDSLGWEGLESCVSECNACALHRTRTQTVFGVGNREASWLVIGEAPGEQEDLKGEPFVGRAGQLLNEMLRAVGLSRQSVYIANILKCRPPQNRDPRPEEADACEAFLKRQLALIQPRIIIALGRIAAQNLLKTDTPIGKLRGSVHRYAGTALVVTYHPAYLLRSPLEKRKAWDDLQLAQRTFADTKAP